MGGSLGPVAIRPRLKVSLKDRLQDELERSLDHAVTNRGDRENTDPLSIPFRYLHPPDRRGTIPVRDQLIPDALQKPLHPVCLDGLKTHPVNPRNSIVPLGQLVGLPECLHLADVDVEAPEPPGPISLRLDVYPPSQILQTDGRLCHLALASPIDRGITKQ